MKKHVIGSPEYKSILFDAIKTKGYLIELIDLDTIGLTSIMSKEGNFGNRIEVIVADNPDEYPKTIEELQSKGINQIKLVNPALYLIHHYDLFNFDRLLVDIDDWKKSIDYLEFHVTDNCNLKCKGCTHFCNLVKGEKNTDYVKWEKDIDRLNDLVENIYIIRILGGEPFLNKDVNRFIEYTRRVFDNSEIHIVTNGILIDKVSEKVFECIRDNNIIIDVSHYPVLNRDEVVSVLDKHNVKYRISDEKIKSFSKCLEINGENNIEKSYATCINHGCHFMYDGYICTCAFPLLSHYYNEYYEKTVFPEKVGAINLHDKVIEKGELRNLLDRPIDFCKNCSQKSELYEWEPYRKNPMMMDWVIEE